MVGAEWIANPAQTRYAIATSLYRYSYVTFIGPANLKINLWQM